MNLNQDAEACSGIVVCIHTESRNKHTEFVSMWLIFNLEKYHRYTIDNVELICCGYCFLKRVPS
jgi:hypothetical protein